jgi:glycosyltransferase involved in cell wall biosynthesis
LRILVVQETDWVERNPVMHHRMLESLALRGHDVTVLDYEIFWDRKGLRPVWQDRREIVDVHRYFADAAIRVIRPSMLRVPGLGRLSWLIGTWRELRRILRSEPPDVIVAYGISNAYLASILARRSGIPFVYHLLDALHTIAEPPWMRPVARVVERAVMRRADWVVVINRRLSDYAVEMGADRLRVEAIPVGRVDVQVAEETAREIRTGLGMTDSDFVVLFMGWLYDFSGMRELVLELGRRKAEFPTLRVLVVGEGDLFEPLRRLRTSLGLEDHLIFTGRRPQREIPGYVAASDVCLLPALRTAAMEYVVPAKIGEYMEAGKPIIATRLPGLETEFGALPGILYVDGPEQVLDRVEQILATNNPGEAARRLGNSCLEFVRGREDWDAITSRFETLLSSVRPISRETAS